MEVCCVMVGMCSSEGVVREMQGVCVVDRVKVVSMKCGGESLIGWGSLWGNMGKYGMG